jgi:hypothetical protein
LTYREEIAMKNRVGMGAVTRISSSMMATAILTFLGFGLGGANLALAVTEFDQNVTPRVIFATGGNVNGAFTTDRRNGIELGLRAKTPPGVINSNGDGTYSFTLAETGTSPPRHWVFDWTVNTDVVDDGLTGKKLDDYTYIMGLDVDPGLGVDFLQLDPITQVAAPPFFDHSIGDNSTPHALGVVATDAATYTTLVGTKNVAQNSYRYSIFAASPPMDTYNPDIHGVYDVYLLAINSSGNVVASVEIRVLIGIFQLSCVGFEAPMHQAFLPDALGGGVIARKVKKNKTLPFKAEVFDLDGLPVTDLIAASPPEIYVIFITGLPTVAIDVTADALPNGKRTDGPQFIVISGDTWSYNLPVKGFTETGIGQYYASIISGDPDEYVISPGCVGVFVIDK